MKLRTTTPVSVPFRTKLIIVVSIFVLGLAIPFQAVSNVSANQFEERIRALEADISRYEDEAAELAKEADTLQRQVSRLATEKATIQAQIDISQAKFDQLTEQIAETEKQIKDNQDGLGSTIADLYVDGEVSPIEMLASSGNITDFLNKQEYRNSVRDQLSTTIKRVKELKAQLSQQKADVDKVLKDQKAQRKLLQEKEDERRSLLAKTQNSEANYRELSSQAQAEKLQVQREQQAAIEAAIRAAGGGGNAVAGDPNKGGYPSNLANSDYYNPLVDPWGMYSRQCVSYTAWKVYQKNGYMPYWGGVGNANQWPNNARNAGIPVSSVPRAGSVGVIMAGQYGHVVWVEGINSNGTINVSQYNYFNAGGSGWGHYSEMYNVSPGAYDYYIYF
jgi:surface antigen/cell division protein FtsB